MAAQVGVVIVQHPAVGPATTVLRTAPPVTTIARVGEAVCVIVTEAETTRKGRKACTVIGAFSVSYRSKYTTVSPADW